MDNYKFLKKVVKRAEKAGDLKPSQAMRLLEMGMKLANDQQQRADCEADLELKAVYEMVLGRPIVQA